MRNKTEMKEKILQSVLDGILDVEEVYQALLDGISNKDLKSVIEYHEWDSILNMDHNDVTDSEDEYY